MHLIFIRHGDPDYVNNTVTEKGKKEVEFLTERIKNWKVTDFFVSPYGRAQDTIKPYLEQCGKTAKTLDWLREFDVKVKDPLRDAVKSCPWDFFPRHFFGEKKYFSLEKWLSAKTMKTGDVKERYELVCNGIDEVLAGYGYNRLDAKTPVYTCKPHFATDDVFKDDHLNPYQKDYDDTTLVFTCHLGVMFAVLSHLLGISPVQLWQGFFVAPTSVTSLGAEERIPGEVTFRLQMMGDVSHLTAHGEKASASGFFGNYLNL